ncbi:MAG TPA: ABC transporter permease subunit [Fervidobacterium sp.]|nr:ABC transporter permease subunit [Fervidobacterium sp.]HOV53240.1 ABC transporter permease subunit [Fervidobacterium sp.]HPC24169.1 ABC transporter permease subunit [Fervidobacterium sp.]HQO05536.1 ABC transporter permease subunit [Fervidobacterium sp.]
MAKKRKVLTHIILIVVCIVVLFPIVWVVSTSLRRDNAAFSTKMFSSRLTIQNYRDLLAPEQNGPRLVSDIDALILSAPPHDKITTEEAKQLFAKDVQKFQNYIKETESLKAKIDENINEIRDYFEQNSDQLIATFSKNLDDIITVLNFEKPAQYIDVAAYDLYNNGVDLSSISDVDPTAGQQKWEEMIGGRKSQIEILKGEIDSVNSTLQPLQKSYAAYQSQFTNQIGTIKSLLVPQLKEYSKVLNSLLQILESAKNSSAPAEFLPDEEAIKSNFTTVLSAIADVRVKTEKYQDLQEISDTVNEFVALYNKVLSQWENFSYKDRAPYRDFLNTTDAFTTNVASTIKESVQLLNQLNSTTEKMLELQAQINQYSSNLTRLQNQLDKLNDEVTKAYEEISPALIYLNSEVVKAQLSDIKSRVSSLKLPTQLQLLNIQSKRVFGLVTDFASQLPESSKEQKSLRALIKNIDWPGTAKDMFTNYDLFVQSYEPYMKELKMYLNEVSIQGPEFMNVSKTGIKVRPQSLEKLTDVVLSTYRSDVVPSMNVMSRKATELSDKLDLSSAAKGQLKAIDGAAFRIDQIWQRKADNYLVRWILNSIIVAITVSLITTAVTALAAYPFSRMRFKGRKYGIMGLLLIQMFPAIMYMIAIYTFLSFAGKYIPGFGLSKLSGLIFAYLGGIAYNMYLIKGYYDTIPDSLEEAALIDGATRWQTFVKIVIPLASPILAVIVILTFMSTFNEFILAKIILQDVKQYTYAVGLYTFSTGPFETEWGLFTAAALIGMVPMVVLFLLMQRYIVGGLVSGAVKG